MINKADLLTTSAGNPIADNQNSITVGPRGPLLVQDYQLLEKLAHQNRERIPERTVHAKGSGAYGTLTITNDITQYSKARVFGKIETKTECLLRFSTVAGERGAAEPGNDMGIGPDDGGVGAPGDQQGVDRLRHGLAHDVIRHDPHA